MHKVASAVCVIAFFAFHSARAGPESQPSVQVSVGFIGEIRVRSLDAKPDSRMTIPSDLQLFLKLQNGVASSGITYANLRIDQAVDDRGREMLPPSRTLRLTERQRTLRPVTPTAQMAPVYLSPTGRDATSIARLKGQLQLRVGQDPTTVVIPRLKSCVNDQPIADASLAKMGVQVSVASAGDDESLWVTAKATPEFLGRIEVLDERQHVIAEGRPFTLMYIPNPEESVKLPRGVDDTMSLKITVYARTTIVTVPFDLKDIPLP